MELSKIVLTTSAALSISFAANFNSVLTEIQNSPESNLSQELKDAIAYMGNEERLAYDVYMNLYNYHKNSGNGEIKQLYNISTRSETKHIQTVQALVDKYDLNADELTNVDSDLIDNPSTASIDEMPSGKYDIPEIQELYDTLYAKGVDSVQDALEVGCMVEVTDVNDLNEDIEIAKRDNADDVVTAFEFLRDGSYNHYWAFDSGLKNMGIEDGCCSLGEEYCHPEYPKNENQGGNSFSAKNFKHKSVKHSKGKHFKHTRDFQRYHK